MSDLQLIEARLERLQKLYWRPQHHRPKIVIIGAGYAGLTCAIGLQKIDADVILVNQNDFHHLTTLLHEPAVGRRDFSQITVDLPSLLRETVIDLKVGEATKLDLENQSVTINAASGEEEIDYDFLVIALGSKPAFYNIPGLEENAWTLNNWQEAARLHLRVEETLLQYKEHPEEKWRTRIIIGGAGLTGVELAGELADAYKKLSKDYGIKREDLNVTIVNSGPTVLSNCEPCQDRVIPLATQILERKGVELVNNARVQSIEPNKVVLNDGRELEAGLIIWTGGVNGHPLLEQTGLPLNRQKRAFVNEFLQTEKYPEVFVVGDSAAAMNEGGETLPPTAQVAIWQGPIVADNFHRLLEGQPMRSSMPKQVGLALSLGHKDALAVVKNKYNLSGWAARLLKNIIGYKYLAQLGGLKLVWAKMRRQDTATPAIIPPRHIPKRPLSQRLGVATLAGLLGTAAFSTLGSLTSSLGWPLDTPKMLSDFLQTPLAIGWLVHGTIGTLLAWFYVFVFDKRWGGTSLMRGLFYGLIAFLAAQMIVLPIMGAGVFSSAMGAAAPALVLGSFLGHWLYAASASWIYERGIAIDYDDLRAKLKLDEPEDEATKKS